jgi:hypothetical protein
MPWRVGASVAILCLAVARAVETDDGPELTPNLIQCDVDGAECGLCFRDVPSVLAFDLAGMREVGFQNVSEYFGNSRPKITGVLACSTRTAAETVSALAVRARRPLRAPHGP